MIKNKVAEIVKRGTCNNVWQVAKLVSLELGILMTEKLFKKVDYEIRNL